MSTHQKSPFPPPPPCPKTFPSSESIRHRGEGLYRGLAQSVVVERPGPADADQPCREAVERRKPSFPRRAFSALLVSLSQCKAAEASDHSLLHFSGVSVIEIGSYFVICQVPDRHQRENTTTTKQKMKCHFFSNFIKKYLFNVFLNMTGTLHYGFFSKLDTRQPGPFVAKSSPECFFVKMKWFMLTYK